MMNRFLNKFDDKPIVSYLFVFLCSFVYLFEVLVAKSLTIDGQTLVSFGAKQTSLVLNGDYYRLVAPIFLHLDLMHILTNMISIIVLGGLAEVVITRSSYIVVLIFGGIMGNVFSTVFSSNSIAAGASTSIFAIMGVFLYFYLFSNDIALRNAAKMVVVIAIVNLALTGIGTDLLGHIGGFVGGFVLAPGLTMLNNNHESIIRRLFSVIMYIGIVVGCFMLVRM